MDFKERFKGRTTNMKKEGFIDTFSAAANPVMKSQSNSQLPSASKINSTVTNDFQANPMQNQRHIAQHSVENRPQAQAYPSHSYSKSPVGHSHNQNFPTQQSSYSQNSSAVKNPYLVNNPFPSFDMMDNQGNYENGVKYHRLNPKNIANQLNNQQNPPNNEFNPNSFYNQHSQFRNSDQGGHGSPLKENVEKQGYGGYATSNQMFKKNFEDLSQQNKQKKFAGDALRGFENQNMYNQPPPNRQENYDQYMPNYTDNVPFPVNGYNGTRDIHSNPIPHHHLEANAFGNLGYTAGNMTQQMPRGRQYEDNNTFYQATNTEPIKVGGYSKTSYKPYNIKEYKDLKKAPAKLGGLGPNTGTEEWQKTKEKKDKMAEFSQNVKMFNSQRTTGMENKPRREKEKEVSKREIALQFAKNIPKPRPKREYSQDEEDLPELEVIKSKSDKPVNYGHNELDEFEQKHMQYLAQLERMKLN